MRPAHYPCPDQEPHGWHAGPHGPDGYWYLCVGVRQKRCSCSYLPWYAARTPLARAMRAGVFLINPHCAHHGMPAAGWRWLGPGYWVKDESQRVGPVAIGPMQLWCAPIGTAAPRADLRGFQRLGLPTPTPWSERQSSVKQLTTGNPR
jgi:hypothetical protein